jgi:hypothetical protein
MLPEPRVTPLTDPHPRCSYSWSAHRPCTEAWPRSRLPQLVSARARIYDTGQRTAGGIGEGGGGAGDGQLFLLQGRPTPPARRDGIRAARRGRARRDGPGSPPRAGDTAAPDEAGVGDGVGSTKVTRRDAHAVDGHLGGRQDLGALPLVARLPTGPFSRSRAGHPGAPARSPPPSRRAGWRLLLRACLRWPVPSRLSFPTPHSASILGRCPMVDPS